MIPHERTRLTYAEQQALLELERSLERVPATPEPRGSWPYQVAGVVIVAVSALLVAGIAWSSRSSTSVVLAAMAGVAGLMVGAVLAIDPLRHYVRAIPPAASIAGWRRRRLARRLDRASRPARSGRRTQR